MRRLFFLSFFLLSFASLAGESLFPRPAPLEADVLFWIRIYTEVGTNGGLIHDASHLEVTYKKIIFPEGISRKEQTNLVDKEKDRIKNILTELAAGKRENLNPEEQEILDLWPQGVSDNTLAVAIEEVRFQLGQANKFKEGLVRSGAWLTYIKHIFAEMNVPLELAALPHVESSFNPHAYSKVGAAGLWQFTRSTGRRFLRLDNLIDERMDPHKATIAAGRLLKYNYAVTYAWPLAVTSYNHGAAGMRRATNELGTREIETIVRKYKGPSFGFASRNFYLSFLAALDVENNAEKYFGTIKRAQPLQLKSYTMPNYMTINNLSHILGVQIDELKNLNPALRPLVWSGKKPIPKGYVLNVDSNYSPPDINRVFATTDKPKPEKKPKEITSYRVQRGDTLTLIAARNDVSVTALVNLNHLRSKRIKVGQVLRLLGKEPLESIAQKQTDDNKVAKNNQAETYQVKKGDTFASIAKQFGLDKNTLLAANDLNTNSRLKSGQVLNLSKDKLTESDVKANETLAPPKREKAQSVPSEPTGTIVSDEDVEEELQAVKSSNSKVASEFPTLDPAIKKLALQPAQEDPIAKVERKHATVNDDVGTIPKDDSDKNNKTATVSQQDLKTDPNDYTVNKDKTIEVQALETFGHYADWLEISVTRLRQINHIKARKSLALGMRIKLDFSKIKLEEFEQRRVEYHRAIQEEFFSKFQIEGSASYKIKKGDSLWSLIQEKQIPVWLFRQYNPNVDLDKINHGTVVLMPNLVKKEEGNIQPS